MESLEPLWLKNYRKRQKERRERQEKNETLSVEGSVYGRRPIAPKLSGTAARCAVAVPSGSVNGEQVTWVAITTATSPWKAVTTPQPVELVHEVTENIHVTSSYPETIPHVDRYVCERLIEEKRWSSFIVDAK